MNIEFTLTKEDHAALQKAISHRILELSTLRSKLFFANILAWIPIGIALSTTLTLFRRHPEVAPRLTILIAALVVSAIVMFCVKRYWQSSCRKLLIAGDSWFLSKQKVDINESGVSATAQHCTAQYTWSSFRHLAEDEKNIYLFVDNAQALTLPKYALGSNDMVEQIKTWLKQRP